MRLIAFLLFALCVKSISVSGQSVNYEKIDSIYSELGKNKALKERGDLFYELSKTYSDVYPDSTIKYALKSLAIYSKTGEQEATIIDLNYRLGVAYLDLNLEKSHYFIKQSLAQSRAIKDDRMKSMNYLAYAAYYSRLPNLDSSTYYLIEATEYFIEMNDSLSMAYCYFGVMSNYNETGNLKGTIEYGEMTLKIARSIEIKQLIGPTIIALAHSYFKTDDNKLKAEHYVLEAEEIAKKDKNKHLLLEVYLTKGIHNYKNDDYETCIFNYQKALELSLEVMDTFNISNCNFKLGLANFKIGNHESAAAYFEESIDLGRSSREELKKSYIYLAMIYASADSHKQNDYLTKYDSISSIKDKLDTEALLLKFETSEKEREIERLKTKEIENELLIQKGRFNITLTVGILLFLLLIIVTLLFAYRSRQKSLKQRIELEKRKTEEAKIELDRKKSELAFKIHALKDNIAVIKDLKMQIKEKSKDEFYINTIVNSLEQNYVSEEHWDNIIHHFSVIYKEHIADLKSKGKNIRRNDIKLSILMKLDYTNTGMSEILNISIEGVKKAKQRLKKKLESTA